MFKAVFGTPGFSFKAITQTTTSRTYATAVSAAKRNTVKPLDSRKTFLIDSYVDLMRNNKIVLLAHRNNLLKSESAAYRLEINSIGGQFVVIRNNLMKVYLRSEHEKDPADVSINKKNHRNKHPLFSLLNGPTAIIAFKDNDPSKIKKLVKFLNASSTKDKLFLIGAKIDETVYNLDQLNEYKELPTKEQLQAQLVGLLNILGGYGLTRTLESASNVLYLTLKSHHDNVENPKTEEKTEDSLASK